MEKATRTIVLTGCTRGLGRALLDRFVEAGCTVAGCGRSGEAVEELRRRFGPPHHFAAVDVSDREQASAWAEAVLDSCGPPDLLINNAALMNPTGPLWAISAEDFDRVVDVNVKGVFYVIQAFVPAMVARGRGVIVNFSSGWGRSVDADVAPYCATKWAIEGMTLALAEDLPEGLAAVPLNPGVIDTDMLRSCWGEFAEQCHKPEPWSHVAAKVILGLGPEHNGRQLAVSVSGS